jgi:hypothetical protein
MGQARDEAGNIWETDAQGNPVRLLQPAQGPQTLGTPDPRIEGREERAQAAAERQAEAAQRDAQNDSIANQLKMAELELKRQQADREGNTAKQLTEWRGNLGNIALLEEQLGKLRNAYETNFKGKGLQSIAESFAPEALAPQYGVFDTISQSMIADMARAKGLTSQQFNTPAEQRMFFEPLLPKRGDTDEKIEEKLNYLETMIAQGRRTTEENLGASGQQADNEVPRANAVDDQAPPGLPPANSPGPVDTTPLPASGGGTQTVMHPEISSMVQSMMAAGAGFSTINAALKERNASPISFSDFANAKKWMEENPGKAYPVTATEERPLSFLEQTAGSPLGAFLANYADSATAGTASALAGDRGEGALDAMSAMNPNASMGGDILGGITGVLGGEAALAARAPVALAKWAPRAADTAYGGLYGFNTAEEGEGLAGAGIGAATGLAGGFLGEKAMRGVGKAVRGVTDPAVQYLRQQGVPLTVGQAVGNSGVLGQGVKKVEDSLTSIPGVGNMVEARRMEGLDAFNHAAFQNAAPPGAEVTGVGAAGMDQLKKAVGEAYSNALDPVQIMADDPQFIDDLAGAIRSAQGIPNVNSAQDAAMAGLESRISGAINPDTDTMTGRGFQEAYRGLARTGRERANGDYGHEIGQVMRQGQDALGEVLERQNPGAFQGFLEANAANRRANVLAQALGPAANQADELITPAQLNRADVQSTSRLEGRINSAAGNRPFYDLATAGQAVLPSRLPDSGTWTRALTGLGLTGAFGGGGAALGGGEGAATGTGVGLGATLALMAGGTRGAQSAAVKALLDRPEMARILGDLIKENARIGGTVGAGTATPLMVGR